jgi:hypothetical protein
MECTGTDYFTMLGTQRRLSKVTITFTLYYFLKREGGGLGWDHCAVCMCKTVCVSVWQLSHVRVFCLIFKLLGARGDAVGWGTALQAGRSRVRIPVVSVGFFIDLILPIGLWPWGRISVQQKWVPGMSPGGKSGRCVGLTNNFLKP